MRKNFTEEDWKLACQKRWAWIRELLEQQPGLDATSLAKKSIKVFREGSSYAENKILVKINDKYRSSKIAYEIPSIEFPKHSW